MAQLSVRAFGGSAGGFGRSAPADASGQFEMKGLSAGPLTLSASSGLIGGRSVTKTIQIPEGASDFETSLEFPKGHTVEGTVSRGGKPIAGASIFFQHAESRTSASATTDAAGRYRAEDLLGGDYDVTVMQFSTGLNHSEDLSVEADEAFDIELPLHRLFGRVVDVATGEPLPDARLEIDKDGQQGPGGGGMIFRSGARTDATGEWAFEGLDEGRYTLTVRRDKYAFKTRSVVIVASAEPDEVVFEMERSEGISFRVRDALTGKNLETIGVLALTGGGDPLAPGGSGASVAHQGTLGSDDSGLFRLETLPPGEYRLALSGESLATEMIHDLQAPAHGLSFTMAPGGGIEASLPSLETGETARAVLLDRDGRPVNVKSNPMFMSPEPAFTIRAGAAATLRDVKPGDYLLRVSLPKGGVKEAAVTVAAGATVSIAIP
jgi:protocatechuate 3,4-dioxygenase beta subunit